MTTLPNFPFKNQLDEPNLDHIPDINADENCLPTCIASGLQFLLKVPFTGEEIQHSVYGNTYRGGTSAVEYIKYVAQQGIALFSRSGSPSYLVDQIRFWLGQGCPVIATIPSTYAPPKDPMNPGNSHCIVFFEEAADTLVAMNPWRAFAQGYKVSYWESIFCYGQVWILQVPKGKPALNVPKGWTLSPDSQTLTAPNGHFMRHAFKDFVLAHDWHTDDVPQQEEQWTERDANGNAISSTILMSQERLNWSIKSGVQLAFIGSEVLSLQSQVSQGNATIETLKTQIALKPTPALPLTLIKDLNVIESQLATVIDSLAQPPKGQ